MPFHRLFAVPDCFNKKSALFDRTLLPVWPTAACDTWQAEPATQDILGLFPVNISLPAFPGIYLFLIFIKYFQTAKNPQTLMFTGFSQLPE